MIERTLLSRSRNFASIVSPSITGMLMSSRIKSMSGSASSFVSASSPLPANVKTNSPPRICLRNRWVISSSKSGSSSTARIRATAIARPLRLRRGQPGELRLQMIEIDRLGDELDGAEFVGTAAPLVVAIGRDHHHRQLRPALLHLPQQGQPVHAGHIDVGQNHQKFGLDRPLEAIERLFAGAGEMQHISSIARLAAKTLAEHVGDVGLVIDHKNTHTHKAPRLLVYRLRGSRMVNSVKLPTALSTAIVPPCCCVTMS